jgi:hypothetical protein
MHRGGDFGKHPDDICVFRIYAELMILLGGQPKQYRVRQ